MTTDLSPTAELLKQAGGRKTPRTALIALALAGVLVAGGGGFALGRVTAPTPTFAGFRGGNGGNGFPGFGGGGGNGLGGGGLRGGGLQGTVESLNGDTLTLKTANGSTITVTLSSTTTYAKQVGGQASDITQGATVRIGVNFAAGAPAGASVPATSVTLITP
jgi:hypothetical protein